MSGPPDVRLTRGQIAEAIQNVLVDYETTEDNWRKNKQDVMNAIAESVNGGSGGEHGGRKGGGEEEAFGGGEREDGGHLNELQARRLVQKREREKQWKAILEHWEGVEGDFRDLDKNFELLGDTLAKARQYWQDTTCKTTQELIDRNDEIAKQGEQIEAVEKRANKIRSTQDKMNAMMNSPASVMGRVWCPAMMLGCCLTLTAILSSSIMGSLNIQMVSDSRTPAPSSEAAAASRCTAEGHRACIAVCDAADTDGNHSLSSYKACVAACGAGCSDDRESGQDSSAQPRGVTVGTIAVACVAVGAAVLPGLSV